MKDILVFSHMMKTAGTSLSKQLIEYYGKKVHIVPGGLLINDDYYNNDKLYLDFNKKNQKLKVLIGHPVRPYIDFDLQERNLRWFTFFRQPVKRYLSHYLHKYHESNQFQHVGYASMKSKNIVEWEKVDNCSNYQCKFISGEANAQKAIDIIETKFDWVGLTEEYQKSIKSFKTMFQLNDLYTEEKIANKSLASGEMKSEISSVYKDFMEEMNTEDKILYEYIKTNVWPKYENLLSNEPKNNYVKSSSILRGFKLIEFQIDRQMNFSDTKLTVKNIKIFYNRWLKK